MCCGTKGVGCRKFLIDDEGELRIASDRGLSDWARSIGGGAADPFEAALDRGLVHIWLCGGDALVMLRPERVSPLTVVGVMNEIARLDQDWTIICSMTPGGRVEWYRGSLPAIRRLAALVEEAERRKLCTQQKHVGDAQAATERLL